MIHRSKLLCAWSFDDDVLVASSNALVALTLLRCARGIPGALSAHSYDDVARALEPAIAKCPILLRKALRSPLGEQEIGELPLRVEIGSLLGDVRVLRLLGYALAFNLPSFAPLFDRVDRLLVSFINSQTHATDRNVEIVARVLSLPEAAVKFLRVAVALCHTNISSQLFSFVEGGTRIAKAVGLIVGCSAHEAEKLYARDKNLWRSGLLSAVERIHGASDLRILLELSSMGERLLANEHSDESSLVDAVLKPFVPPAEALDWPHLQQERQLLEALLRNATSQQATGVNILIHGEPGTGKTEFVRQVLHDLGLRPYAIDHKDDRGFEASRRERLCHLQLSRMFAGKKEHAVLVLDEAEDIFVGDHHHPFANLFRAKDQSKAWMNEVLESAPQPVIWICNRVGHMDPAYLRRFTYCLPFPKPPQALRQLMVRQRLETLGCTDGLMNALAELPHTTPALIDSTARFLSLSQGAEINPDEAAQIMVQGHLDTAGREATLRPTEQRRDFDMSLVNVAGGVTAPTLVKWLLAEGRGTVLFAGPPGTGKTQLAAELAQQTGRKLVVKTASDILSKWYGESERNVAAMFRNCDPKTEVLFLDEGDVLLADRGEAGHRVDRGVTAEFLRWLEEFEGIFVCATNYAQHLDPALARRFTHRLNFLALSREQRRSLLANWALGDAQAALGDEVRTAIDQLDRLTPGDFANVRKRLRHQQPTVQDWVAELAQEQAAKPWGQRRAIGFI